MRGRMTSILRALLSIGFHVLATLALLVTNAAACMRPGSMDITLQGAKAEYAARCSGPQDEAKRRVIGRLLSRSPADEARSAAAIGDLSPKFNSWDGCQGARPTTGRRLCVPLLLGEPLVSDFSAFSTAKLQIRLDRQPTFAPHEDWCYWAARRVADEFVNAYNATLLDDWNALRQSACTVYTHFGVDPAPRAFIDMQLGLYGSDSITRDIMKPDQFSRFEPRVSSASVHLVKTIPSTARGVMLDGPDLDYLSQFARHGGISLPWVSEPRRE